MERGKSYTGDRFEPWALIRLTTLRVRPAGGDWLELARDMPTVDGNGAYVKLLDDLPMLAIEGAELELKVTWVKPPPAEDYDEDYDQ